MVLAAVMVAAPVVVASHNDDLTPPALPASPHDAHAATGTAPAALPGAPPEPWPPLSPGLLVEALEGRIQFHHARREGSALVYYGAPTEFRSDIVAAVEERDAGVVVTRGDPVFTSNIVAAAVVWGPTTVFTRGDPAFRSNIAAAVERRPDAVVFFEGDPAFGSNAVLSIGTRRGAVEWRRGAPDMGNAISERDFLARYERLVERVLAPIVARFPPPAYLPGNGPTTYPDGGVVHHAVPFDPGPPRLYQGEAHRSLIQMRIRQEQCR